MLETINRLESEVRGYVRSFPTVFESAENAKLTDANGKTFVDFFAGAGTLNYGHNNPKAKEALLEYVSRNGIWHGLDKATGAKIEFLNTFESAILKPRKMDYKIQFTGPTGTNCVEAAIKLARQVKKRSHVVAFTNAYHGHSLGSLALTGNDYYHSEFYGSRNNVTHLPFDGYMGYSDTSVLLQKMLDDKSSGLPTPAAVILETVQGEGGVNVASRAWLQEVAKICRKRDILLIVDDIQVGNGRTGRFFSFESSDIQPDMVCLSKSIGGGLPMAILLMKRELDEWKPGQHTGTFRGNNLAFVAGNAVLDYWRTPDFAQEVKRKGEMIRNSLTTMADGRGFKVRGRGMIWGLDVNNGDLANRITDKCFRNGLVIESAGAEGNVVKLLPPLTIETETLNAGLTILNDVINEEAAYEAPCGFCPIDLTLPTPAQAGAATE